MRAWDSGFRVQDLNLGHVDSSASSENWVHATEPDIISKHHGARFLV